jgi:hypothetical protein
MDIHFYKHLPETDQFSQLAEPKNYTRLPESWCIAISDVRNSTRHVKQGKYRQVNMMGASMIAAVSNELKHLELPFSFSGDGAVIAFPASYKKQVEQVLIGCRIHAKKTFNLNLAAGVIPILSLNRLDAPVYVAKYRLSEHVTQAAFMGSGLIEGERRIKKKSKKITHTTSAHPIDLTGLECRWNPFPANEIAISLIVSAVPPYYKSKLEIYRQVLKRIHLIFEGNEDLNPVRAADMKLSFRPKNLWAETKTRSAASPLKKLHYYLKLYCLQFTGKWLMKLGIKTSETNWFDYKPDFVANSDFRKFESDLIMILTGNRKMKRELTAYLKALYHEGVIVYGLHESSSTITTCYVKKYQSNHIHFIDGSGGGYTRASIDLKKRRTRTIKHFQKDTIEI